jgi:hypothetical protein
MLREQQIDSDYFETIARSLANPALIETSLVDR